MSHLQYPHPHLVSGDELTREAIMAAQPPDGKTIRADGAIEVYVACNHCGDLVRSWITPRDTEAPVTYCDYCEWALEQDD